MDELETTLAELQRRMRELNWDERERFGSWMSQIILAAMNGPLPVSPSFTPVHTAALNCPHCHSQVTITIQ